MSRRDYNYIVNDADFKNAVEALAREPVIGFDTETTGLDPHTSYLRLIQLASPTRSYVFDIFKINKNSIQPLMDILSDNRIVKIAHNSKFDLKFIYKYYGVRIENVFDTMLASQIIGAGVDGERHNLAETVMRNLRIEVDKGAQVSNWGGELSDYQLDYAAKDASVLLPLREKQVKRLDELGLTQCAQLEFDSVLPIALMEVTGVFLDVSLWRAIIPKIKLARDIVASELHSVLGGGANQLTLFGEPEFINLDSPAQVKEALARIGIEVEDTREWRLQKMSVEYPILEKLIAHRGLSKSLSSYGEGMVEFINPVTRRIHASFRQIGTPTGRITTTSPSLQQIPKSAEYRECFRAPFGRKLIIADYSQIEMRILADIANDDALIAAFESGVDLHRLTSSQMLGIPFDKITPQQREEAKRLNYGLVYGMGAEGLASQIKSSVTEAQVLMDRYFNTYSGVARWLHNAGETAVREGRSRSTSGRLWIFKLDRTNPVQAAALRRIGKNAPIQGTASDIFKRALTRLDKALIGKDAKLVNTIHDELVVECDPTIADAVKTLVIENMVLGAKDFLPRVKIEVDCKISDAWE